MLILRRFLKPKLTPFQYVKSPNYRNSFVRKMATCGDFEKKAQYMVSVKTKQILPINIMACL